MNISYWILILGISYIISLKIFNIKLYGVPGSIQVSPTELIRHSFDLICKTKPVSCDDLVLTNHKNAPKDYITIFGYCCRELFSLFMQYQVSINPNIVVAVSPIHHTSFRDIIAKYVKKEKISIS